jgi:hypothetical protein
LNHRAGELGRPCFRVSLYFDAAGKGEIGSRGFLRGSDPLPALLDPEEDIGRRADHDDAERDLDIHGVVIGLAASFERP